MASGGSGTITYTLISDARRLENAFESARARVMKLQKELETLVKQNKSHETAAVRGLDAVQRAITRTVLGYVTVQGAIRKIMELHRELMDNARNAKDPVVALAAAQASLATSMPGATTAQTQEIIAKLTDIANRKGIAPVDVIAQSEAIFSSLPGSIEAKVDRVLQIVEQTVGAFRFKMQEFGEYGGLVADVSRGLGTDQRTGQEILGFLASLREQSRLNKIEAVKNLTPALISAGMFGGDDAENVRRGGAIASAISLALGDTSGELSRTASVNFMHVLKNNPVLQRLAGGKDASLEDYMNALAKAPKDVQTRTTDALMQELKGYLKLNKEQANQLAGTPWDLLLADLRKQLLGRAFTKDVQESGLTAGGLLTKLIAEVLPEMTFDKAKGKQIVEFAEKGTPAIKQAADIVKSEAQGVTRLIDRFGLAAAIDTKLIGDKGLLRTSNFDFQSGMQQMMGRASYQMRVAGGVTRQEAAIDELEAAIGVGRGRQIAMRRGGLTDREQRATKMIEENIDQWTKGINEIRALVAANQQLMAEQKQARREAGANQRQFLQAALNGAAAAGAQVGRHREN